MSTIPLQIQALIEECLREGKEGTLKELIAQRHKEMTKKGYVKNEEGFWVEENNTKVEYLGHENGK